MKAITRRLSPIIFSILLAPVAMAQSVAVSSASITINPAATDSYTLQGAFSGLSLTGGSYVGLSVGNFGATIPLSNFTAQPGTNVYTYQDATGQAPDWVSSLSFDAEAHTFKAQAKSIVLAGLPNPFAVHLGTDQSVACTMVRVQQATAGSYQLTSGDPAGMTCELSNTPVALPKVLVAGAATSVTVNVNALQSTGSDTPQNVQLFRADDNAQPTGNPLCTLSQQSAGRYACSVSFKEANAGMIPLLVQATVGGRQIVAPGFALQVAATATSDDAQQILNLQTAMTQAWQNFTKYGDSAYARLQSLLAFRKLLAPAVALTGSPVGLSTDQEAIYVRSHSGFTMVLPSEDVQELLPGVSANAKAAKGQGVTDPPTFNAKARPHGLFREPLPPQRAEPLACGEPQRDIVWNNKVLVWSPGDIFFTELNSYQKIVEIFQKSKCPSYSVNNTDDIGYKATVDSLSDFAQYGTIIINSHGAFDEDRLILLTGDPAPNTSAALMAYLITTGKALFFGDQGIACVPQGCFKFVYPTNPAIQTTGKTVIYASFCHSLEDEQFGFAQKMAPAGSGSTYYGYIGVAYAQEDVTYGRPLFDALVNLYENTGDAISGNGYTPLILSASDRPASNKEIGGTSASQRAAPRGLFFDPDPFNPHFGIWNNLNLGYVGNPKLTMTDQPPPDPGSQNLAAYLEGAASCGSNGAPFMNVNWENRAVKGAMGGHLNWLTSLVSGSQDSFTNEASENPPDSTPGTQVSDFALAKWTPSAELPGTADDVVADFFPDMANPVAARACLGVSGAAGLFVQSQLAGVYDGAHVEQQPQPQRPARLRKITRAYTVPLQDPCGCSKLGASASVTITPNGPGKYTVKLTAGSADPTPGAGQGPYDGEVGIDLEAINPGTGAQVIVSGSFDFTPPCGANASICSFPDGVIMISGDPNISTNISLYPGDHATSPFGPITLDTSKDSAFVYVGMNVSGEIATPAVFPVTINIQFVNPTSSTKAAVGDAKPRR